MRIDPLEKDTRVEIRKGADKERLAFFIQAYPSAHYTWLKDNKEIRTDNPLYKFRSDFDSDVAVLRLLNIREEHAGRYTLMGRSGSVVVKETVEIVVLGKCLIFYTFKFFTVVSFLIMVRPTLFLHKYNLSSFSKMLYTVCFLLVFLLDLSLINQYHI